MASFDAVDVQVVALDWSCSGMIGEDGRLYREVRPGLWAHFDSDDPSPQPPVRLFIQTSFHGDGVFLRLIYQKTVQGWVNVSTGKPAVGLPDGL